jgi:hypothetical protein
VITAADVLRVIAVALSGFAFGLLADRLWVCRTRGVRVSLLAIALLLYAIFADVEIASRYGDDLTWRTPLGILAASFAIAGLWLDREAIREEVE